jgi:hypothetical protein
MKSPVKTCSKTLFGPEGGTERDIPCPLCGSVGGFCRKIFGSYSIVSLPRIKIAICRI